MEYKSVKTEQTPKTTVSISAEVLASDYDLEMLESAAKDDTNELGYRVRCLLMHPNSFRSIRVTQTTTKVLTVRRKTPADRDAEFESYITREELKRDGGL
jgi:hypothetical protein